MGTAVNVSVVITGCGWLPILLVVSYSQRAILCTEQYMRVTVGPNASIETDLMPYQQEHFRLITS